LTLNAASMVAEQAINNFTDQGNGVYTGQITVQTSTTALSTNIILSNGGANSDAYVQAINLTNAIDGVVPVVTAENLTVSSPSVADGDSLTITWDNSALGDNNSDIGSVTVDLSAFGGSSSAALVNDGTGVYSVTIPVVVNSSETAQFAPVLTVVDNSGNSTALALPSITIIGVPSADAFIIPNSASIVTVPGQFESFSVVSALGVSTYTVERGNALQFVGGGSGLQFDQQLLSQEGLSIVRTIFNDNFEVSQEVADPGQGDGVKSLDVYDVSPLSIEDQMFILDLLESLSEEPEESSDEAVDEEEDEISYFADEEALIRTEVKEAVEITQKSLDEMTSLSDTLLGEYDCLKIP
jgi:hypothetical protein